MKTSAGLTIGIVGFALGAGLTSATSKENPWLELTHPVYFIREADHEAEMLHRIKLGDIKSVENSMEFDISVDAKAMNEILSSRKSSKEEAEAMLKSLRLLSVMNEKFEIKQWRSDAELQKIFKNAQKSDPAHIAHLRCKNWNKPMWVGADGCP